MVASVHRVKPHEVFDRHRTETGAHDVLATGDPSTTFLVEPGDDCALVCGLIVQVLAQPDVEPRPAI